LRALALALLLLCLPATVLAEAAVRSAAMIASEEGYVVNADFQLDLNPRLIDALQRGVSLHFSVELTVEQPRWYWVDRTVVESTLQYRLAYHAVTRSYRLSFGGLHRTFDSLDAALRTMTRVRNWYVMPYEAITQGAEYRASLRMRHQIELLPKLLVVTATGGREWTLATPWLRWQFSGEPRP
jgi:hypothetical protein